MKRYEEIAELLAADIRSGQLAPGARLPSIRTVTARYRVSPATAFAAYYRLEERGLVRARERSGYFVTGAADGPQAPAETQPASRSALVSAEVDISELVFTVLESARTGRCCRWARRFRHRCCFRCPAGAIAGQCRPLY